MGSKGSNVVCSSWIKPTNYIRNVKFLMVDCHSHDGFTVPLLQLTYNPNHSITSYPLIEENGDQLCQGRNLEPHDSSQVTYSPVVDEDLLMIMKDCSSGMHTE
ncbi:unnamed protein product [Lactuca saligna]|uniref:Uncharacterized protein n=1 Tax=Lactuca saligna TaxID=75948 RepID=A0AA35ZK24_LACSI|nr:unnamed protein product [Lactuca saligna]